jgi:hypothetical protein
MVGGGGDQEEVEPWRGLLSQGSLLEVENDGFFLVDPSGRGLCSFMHSYNSETKHLISYPQRRSSGE